MAMTFCSVANTDGASASPLHMALQSWSLLHIHEDQGGMRHAEWVSRMQVISRIASVPDFLLSAKAGCLGCSSACKKQSKDQLGPQALSSKDQSYKLANIETCILATLRCPQRVQNSQHQEASARGFASR